MQPKPITHRNIFRVLTAGFGLVVILLLAAALVAVRNIHAIRQSAAGLIGEQEVARRLIGELHGQQTSLAEVFSVLARDPDSVDEGAILQQLDAADADTARIAAEGARTADRDLWARLRQASLAFSSEARHILAEDEPETFAPVELFREHEDFMSVVARLVEREYRHGRRGAGATQSTDLGTAPDHRDLRRRERAAGARLRHHHRAHGVAADSRNGMADGRTGPRLLAHAGGSGGHRAALLARAARRTGPIAHRHQDQSRRARAGNRAERTADCLHLVDEAIGNVRQMSQLLRPTILDDFGLAASLRWQVEGFAARTGIDARFESNFDGRLPGETETHLFRIAQEALTNVARHAVAHRVTVKLMAEKRAAPPERGGRWQGAGRRASRRPRHGHDRHARPRPHRRRRADGTLAPRPGCSN
jgi:hypothetical protein